MAASIRTIWEVWNQIGLLQKGTHKIFCEIDLLIWINQIMWNL